jgi:hypothetical protein
MRKRADCLGNSRLDPFAQFVFAVVVHQEADRTAVHAVDPLSGVHEAVQRLQHETVAAERDDGLGLLDRLLAVERREQAADFARFRRIRRQKGDGVGDHRRAFVHILASALSTAFRNSLFTAYMYMRIGSLKCPCSSVGRASDL